MQGDRGGAQAKKKKRRVSPVPRTSSFQKQATIRAQEDLLASWEMKLPPKRKPPTSLVMINPPPRAFGTQPRRERRLEHQRYRAALAAPVNAPIKVPGRKEPVPAREYLAETMSPQRRREHKQLLIPPAPAPPHGPSLLHGLLSTSLLDIGRHYREVPGIAKAAALYGPKQFARSALEAASEAGQPARGPVRIPGAARASLAGAAALPKAVSEVGLGPNITKALEGKPFSRGGLALEAALVAPGLRPVRFGRALAEGLVASREAVTVAERSQAFKLAYEGAMGGPMLPSKVYVAASRNRAIQGLPLRAQLHDVIDQVVENKTLARQMKKEADGTAHLVSLTRPAGKVRRDEAARVYEDYLTSVQNMPEHPIAGFQPVVAEAKGKTNLARAQNLAKIEGQAPKSTPTLSVHAPKPGDEGVVATGQQVVGEITPEEWWARVQHAVGNDPQTGLTLAHWYRELGPIFRTIFGADGNAVLRGFAVSQANASPAGGLLNVLKVRDKILNHERISKDEISTVVKSIERAYKGQPVEKGLQAKLHDFANSLEGTKRRTWTLDDVRGGAPAAIDVHAARDLGWIDRKILNTLRARHGLPVAHLQLQKLDEELRGLVNGKQPKKSTMDPEVWRTAQDEAIAKKQRQITAFKKNNKRAIAEGRKSGLKMDNASGSPSGYRYEAGRVRYEAIAGYLNEVKAWGKTDWTPAEAQALGWSAIQRIHGTVPEDAMFAVTRNTYTLALEALNEETSMGLRGFSEQMAVTKETVDAILPRLVAEENAYLREISYGSGGWRRTVTPAAQIKVVATPEQIDRMVMRLSGMFDQQDVWGVRAGVSISARKGAGAGKAAVEIFSPEFKDPARVGVFWHQLQETIGAKQARHFQGYSTFTRDGKTGIRVITESRPVAEAKGPEWARQFSEAISEAGDKAGIRREKLRYHHTNVEVRSIATAKASRRARSVLRRSGRLPGMGDPLEAEARQTLGQALARHREAEGTVSRGAATEARRTGFEGPPTPEEEAWRRMHQYREPRQETLPSRFEPPVREAPVTGRQAQTPAARFNKIAVKTSALRARQVELLQKLDKTPLEWEELERIKLALRTKRVIPATLPRVARTRPVEEIVEGMRDWRGAKSLLGKQDVVQRAEKGRRAGAAAEARAAAGGGLAGQKAALAELRGELPRLRFKSPVSEDEVDKLIRWVEDNRIFGEQEFKNIRIAEAFRRVARGQLPQQNQIKLLEEVFGTEKVAELQAEINWQQQVLHWAREAVALPRTMRSSVDFSAPFRQGLFMAYAEPELWKKAWGPGVKAMNKKNYEPFMVEILSRPTAKFYQQSGLAIVGKDGLGGLEEAYTMNLSEYIPLVGHSQRGYEMFLNRLRADTFDEIYRQGILDHPEWLENAADHQKFIKSIATTVNMLTGRGRLPFGWEPAVNAFSAALFSPRLIASRVEYLLRAADPRVWAPGARIGRFGFDPRQELARRMIRRSLSRQVGIAGGLLVMASFIPGVDVDFTDRNSADFLKIKVGDFRLDILGGTQQYLVLASRLISGEKTNSSTGKVTKLEGFSHTRFVDTTIDFLDNKAAPIPAFLLAWDAGKTPIGDEFNFGKQAGLTFTPLGLESAVGTSRDYGVPTGVLDYALSSVGFGTGVYGPRPVKRPLYNLPESGEDDFLGGGGEDILGGGGEDVLGG